MFCLTGSKLIILKPPLIIAINQLTQINLQVLKLESTQQITVSVKNYYVQKWMQNFNDHTSDLFLIASRKLFALARVIIFMKLSKRRFLMNAFFTSQFSYCPIIWMFYSRSNNGKTNMFHETCFCINSYFKDLQSKLGSTVGYHHH